MIDTLSRVWTNLAERIGGPLSVRFLMQPAMAVLLAVLAGRADAKAGRVPYLWGVFTDRSARRQMLREGWKATASVFVVAVVIDAVYQLMELGWFYPGEALIVAFTLACVPYALVRGPVNRLCRRK